MAKDLAVTVLLDFYGELLTERQYRALILYYDEDCSLAEIAELMEVSRQGARDFIKRGEALLNEFEEKLGLAARFMQISKAMDKLEELSASEPHSDKLCELIEEIKNNL